MPLDRQVYVLVRGLQQIEYRWDRETDSLLIQLVKKAIDPVTKETFVLGTTTVPFLPDTLDLPSEIKKDLVKRLPIRNRKDLDL